MQYEVDIIPRISAMEKMGSDHKLLITKYVDKQMTLENLKLTGFVVCEQEYRRDHFMTKWALQIFIYFVVKILHVSYFWKKCASTFAIFGKM